MNPYESHTVLEHIIRLHIHLDKYLLWMIDDIELKTIIAFSFTTKKFDTTKFLIKLFDANSVSVCVKWSEVKVTAFQYTFSNKILVSVIYFINNCIIYLSNMRKERSHKYTTQDKKRIYCTYTMYSKKK